MAHKQLLRTQWYSTPALRVSSMLFAAVMGMGTLRSQVTPCHGAAGWRG